MSKDLSARYYQKKNNERIQKKYLLNDIKIYLNKKKQKNKQYKNLS